MDQNKIVNMADSISISQSIFFHEPHFNIDYLPACMNFLVDFQICWPSLLVDL